MKIRLLDCGNKKIAVIKAIRAATGLNLKDAKALADSAPTTFEANLMGEPSRAKLIIQDFRESGAKIQAEVTASVIDKMTAASYISTAEVALGEGNITESRRCLKSALRLLGDFLDDVEFVGVGDL